MLLLLFGGNERRNTQLKTYFIGNFRIQYIYIHIYIWSKYSQKGLQFYILPMILSFRWGTVMSILLYGCTTPTLTKRVEKKIDAKCARMLRAISNNSGKQTKLCGHLPPALKTSKSDELHMQDTAGALRTNSWHPARVTVSPVITRLKSPP